MIMELERNHLPTPREDGELSYTPNDDENIEEGAPIDQLIDENADETVEASDTEHIEYKEELCEDQTASSANDIGTELSALTSEFSELRSGIDTSSLLDAKRYAELRALGLTPREAYLATAKRKSSRNNRAHLVSAVPASAKSPDIGMSRWALQTARELFSGMSDTELRSLYARCK